GETDLGIAARYHYARALERLHRAAEAKEQYQHILTGSNADNYYALWAQTRLAALEEDKPDTCCGQKPRIAALKLPFDPRSLGCAETQETQEGRWSLPVETPVTPKANLEELANLLTPFSDIYVKTYPWLVRARDLLLLGEPEGAVDEIHEAYLAWRD